MPYQVKKEGSKYRLYSLSKREYTKRDFNSRASAISQGKNWMKYRGEKPIVKGDKILSK